MNGEELPITVNVSYNKIKQAVKEHIADKLPIESAMASVAYCVEQQRKKIEDHADKVIAGIVVPRENVTHRINSLLERDLQKMVRDVVTTEVLKLIRDEVSVAIRHIVQTGITLEIGTGWNQKVKITTEEKDKSNLGP